ncbi:MAG: class I SAM-dependent methyltransferase [Nocardiaceae bacterium]|nr:class I SAM-dependent methyltransferase [Nocardiaceae bacterium]
MPFEWDLDRQAEWVTTSVGTYPAELPLPDLLEASESVGGFRYGPIEAQFLYSYIRTHAPGRIVEIGSGSSTLVMALAVGRNVEEGRPATEILACDPFTADRVRHLPHVSASSIGGNELDREVLELGAGDVLFIDSTHTVRTGSELAHLYLELIPQLQPGVVVHIHDIYLPFLFGPEIYESMFDWQETTLVAALLAGNARLKVLASLSGVFHDRGDALAAAFPEYQPRGMERGIAQGSGHYPSSLWLVTR